MLHFFQSILTRTRMRACWVWLALAPWSVGVALGAVPSYITLEGRVSVSNAPVMRAAKLDVRLYDRETEGALLFEQTNLAVQVVSGFFSAEVGGPSISDALALGYGWVELWLDGAPMLPRKPLHAAPTALWSRRVLNDDLVIDENNRRMGVGIDPPAVAMDVQGRLRLRDTGVADGMVLRGDAAGNASWDYVTGAPQGMIAMWSGPTAGIPSGWAVCDGGNGTPDLRDRFVVGAGGSLTNGATGGSATHAHAFDVGPVTTASGGAHTHTLDIASVNTSTDGAHTHSVNFPNSTVSTAGNHTHSGGSLSFHAMHTIVDYPGSRNNYINPLDSNHSDTRYGLTWYGNTGSGGSHNHTVDVGAFTSGSSGSHNHSVNPAAVTTALSVSHTHTADPAASTSASAESLPPYITLYYIMKL